MVEFDIDAMIAEETSDPVALSSIAELAEEVPVSGEIPVKKYVPPTLLMIPEKDRPKTACAHCRHSLWFAVRTAKEGSYRLKSRCDQLHEIVFDSATSAIPVIEYCDGLSKDD